MIGAFRPLQRVIIHLTTVTVCFAGVCLAGVCLAGLLTSARAADFPNANDWSAVLAQARGETVYFHAWGGDTRINDYIDWASDMVEARHDVEVRHVKVNDTAAVVGQVLAEKSAGRISGGSVDLVWINGANFAAMKSGGLLAPSPWAESLPNWRYVDVDGKPTVQSDFTIPTDGLEAPWGMAQLVFIHDSATLSEPPTSIGALLRWVRRNPGRFAYPGPPDFIGVTFLKQVLLEVAKDPAVLASEATPEAFDALAGDLFGYLDDLHRYAWRSGRVFPENYPALITLLADAEIDIAFAFNPAAAANAIAAGDLPESVRTYVLDDGTIGNTHFVAIPFNANAAAGAMVLANFLMSPEAQARKQDPDVWGDPTVLNMAALSTDDNARFDMLDLGASVLTPDELTPTLPEPHPSWTALLNAAWSERYEVR